MERFKLDTKEKFNVITPKIELNTAKSADELRHILLTQVENQTKNVIINLSDTPIIDASTAEMLADVAGHFMEKQSSFVVCCANDEIKKILNELDILEILNLTPTESEAWDIVQMEEIERELFSNDD